MKKAVVLSCAVAALAGQAFGAEIVSLDGFSQEEGARVFDVRTGSWISQSVSDRMSTTIYQNIAGPTPAGVRHSVANEVVGDDIDPGSFGSLTNGNVQEVTISIANFGADINSETLDLSILFFDNTGSGLGGLPIPGNTIGEIPISVSNFSLAGASFGLVTFSGLDVINEVRLSQEQFWIGVRFDGLSSSDPTLLGQVFYSENPTIGDSADQYYRSSTGNPAFSSQATNNFAYEILVPAPGALAVLGVGGLVATRRRRA